MYFKSRYDKRRNKKNKELISKYHKKTCRNLTYVKHLLILTFAVTSLVSFSVFASLVVIHIGITSCAPTI